MKKILVPCDFSKPAICAFKFALDIASHTTGASVHLLHVIELPVLHDTVLMPVLSMEEQLLNELRDKAEIEFSKLTSKYNLNGTKIVTKVEFGLPSRMIANYSKDHNMDIIMMGSHGASGFREFFIGSNAEKIVRQSSIPVLIMKDYFKGQIKDIVFPNTLHTENQEALVQKVKALQYFFKAKLHILWINTPVNFTPDSVTKDKLNEFAKRFMFKDYTLNIYNHINPEDGILEFTKAVKGNIIAMGTHGRKGLQHFVTGSLTESIVNHSKALVWSYILNEEQAD